MNIPTSLPRCHVAPRDARLTFDLAYTRDWVIEKNASLNIPIMPFPCEEFAQESKPGPPRVPCQCLP